MSGSVTLANRRHHQRAAPARRVVSVGGLAAAVAATKARRKLGVPRAASAAIAFAGPAAVAFGLRPSKARDAVVWAAQMWAYKCAFEMPNDAPSAHRDRGHVDYPIAIDRWLGGGVPPGQRLQRRLGRRGRLTWLDKGLSLLYWTWEVEPHLVMTWLRMAHPSDFPCAAARLAATFDLTLIGYWTVPTAPPWWASEKLGRMDGEVRRLMLEVADWIKGEPNPTAGDHEMGANPLAAMPSDHVASAVMTAIVLSEQGQLPGALGWGYAALLAVALVYLGEHYVADELAGLALALAVNRARKPLTHLTRRLLGEGRSREHD